MKKYMMENRLLFAAYLVSVPIAAVCSSLTAVLAEPLIDVVYSQKHSDFIKYAVLEMIMVVLDLLSHYFHKVFRERLRVYYVAGLKRDLFGSLLKKSISEYQKNTVPQYLSVINRDVGKMNECQFDAVCGIYRVIINCIINVFLIFYLDPWIAAINIGASFLSVLIPRLFEKKLIGLQEKASASSERYYSLQSDYLNGFSMIKIFRIQDKIYEKYERINRKAEEDNCGSVLCNYSVSWISGAFSELSYAVTLALGVYFCLKGRMTVGMVIALSQLIGGIVVPFEELPEYISNIKSVRSISEKIQKLLQDSRDAGREEDAFQTSLSEQEAVSSSEQGTVSSSEQEAVSSSNQKTIVAEQVAFGYGQDKLCLRDVSFTWNKGDKCILIGDSGSGKSTLAKLIAGFYSCSHGRISINGVGMDRLPEELLYQKITYIEQNVFLLEDTLYNNIVLYREYPDEKVEEAVAAAGLSDFVAKLPLGLHTMVHAGGGNLSGGEKQRIGIARALLTDADFLIMDEVTANLDPMMEKQIEEAVWSLDGPGILYITHNWEKDFLDRADQVFRMHRGILQSERA